MFLKTKPTKSKHKPRVKHQRAMACALRKELYSLLPLGIGTPKRKEQECGK
jgi:hypothetical protein